MKDVALEAASPVESRWSETAQKLEAIRFFAMSSVIWGHTHIEWHKWPEADQFQSAISIFFQQIGHEGTPIFFFISGFFLSKSLASGTMRQFFARRWKSVIVPWMIFFAICLAIQLVGYSLSLDRRVDSREMLRLFFIFFKGALFYAGYWFIPISLLSGAILVIFKKYRLQIGFGIVLLLITLMYNVNLYAGWFSSNHTKAFLGYVLYVWLGVRFGYSVNRVSAWIDAIPWGLALGLVVLSAALSGLEGEYLKSLGTEDPFGSIRVTNGIASLLLLLLFLKSGNSLNVLGRQPSRIVFGMYLVHIILLVLFIPALNLFIDRFHLYRTAFSMIALQIVWYVLVVVISYRLAKLIGKSSWRWIIGDVKPAAMQSLK